MLSTANAPRVRARAEHAFGVIKCIFGFAKMRYRGLAKNGNRQFNDRIFPSPRGYPYKRNPVYLIFIKEDPTIVNMMLLVSPGPKRLLRTRQQKSA